MDSSDIKFLFSCVCFSVNAVGLTMIPTSTHFLAENAVNDPKQTLSTPRGHWTPGRQLGCECAVSWPQKRGSSLSRDPRGVRALLAAQSHSRAKAAPRACVRAHRTGAGSLRFRRDTDATPAGRLSPERPVDRLPCAGDVAGEQRGLSVRRNVHRNRCKR